MAKRLVVLVICVTAVLWGYHARLAQPVSAQTQQTQSPIFLQPATTTKHGPVFLILSATTARSIIVQDGVVYDGEVQIEIRLTGSGLKVLKQN